MSRRGAVHALVAALLVACSTPSKSAPKVLVAPTVAEGSRAVTSDAGTAGAAQTPARAGDRDEAALVARTLKKVSALRGIAATKAVPGVVLERDALIARVRGKIEREVPAEAIKREGLVLELLGFIPQRFDYLGQTMSLLDAQLAGFYEPADGTMYLAGDLDGLSADATLAHELVHALQDQRWDLKARSRYRPGESDRSTALAALAEGDATSAMADFILRKRQRTALDVPDEEFASELLGGMNAGEAAHAPHVMRTSLVAPYLEGVKFVHALRRKSGWSGVNQAWDRPPTTTEQILHVDKWEANERAVEVTAPTGTALGAGWTLAEHDTYGEIGLALAFEEWTGAANAKTAAADWGGDRSSLFTSGANIALAMHVRYDASEALGDLYAARAFRLIVAGIEAKVGRATAKDATVLCVERKELGPLAIAKKGKDLVLIAGPATVSDAGWTSAGTCAGARKWGAEVLAQ